MDSGDKLCSTTEITKDSFGTTQNGEHVDRYTFKNGQGMEVDVITFGCYITSIRVPDRDGQLSDVALGFDKLSTYESPVNRFFGAVVGRVCNRINKGQFTLDGVKYQLNINNGPNHLHGGSKGWDKSVWKAEVTAHNTLRLVHVSPNGDENYPGTVTATVEYALTADCQLILTYKAKVEGKATPINMTSHTYFNLAGEGSANIYDHTVTLFADKYLPSNENLIPTGEKVNVAGTPYDLRQPRRLGDALAAVPSNGFDNTFLIRGASGIRLAARVSHAASGRVMEVYTDQPGVQFYTGNFVDISQMGKHGHNYAKHSAFCLETQAEPDAINHENFSDVVLYPGNEYRHYCSYKFSTTD